MSLLQIYELFPWLASNFLPSVKKMKSCRDFLDALFVKELESHKGKRKLDENRHFIDYYLDEIDKVSTSELLSHFTNNKLVVSVFKRFIDYNDV